jgi:hypothetical protein
MKLRWLLLFVFSSFPLVSNAELFADSAGISGNAYFGVQLSGVRYEQDNGYNMHQPAFGLRFGYEVANHIGLEGQLATGIQDDEIGGVATNGVDYMTGLYLRGSMFLWDPRARLSLLAGVTHAKITQKVIGTLISDTKKETDPSYGIGFEFYGDERNGVSLEFMRYLKGDRDNTKYNLDTFNIGYIHRF